MHDPRSLRSQSDENTARWLCEHYPTIAAQDGTIPPRNIKLGHESVSLYTALQRKGVPTGRRARMEYVGGVWEAVWKVALLFTKRVPLK